jgi:LacI family transcriptional regulator
VEQPISSRDSDRGLTISEVARIADVSPATVSRVLNGDHRVGESYRLRVTAAVEQLGYRPNRLARNLRRQRSGAIGVVISDIENPHFSEAVRAIEDLAFGLGHPVLVCNTDETPAKERAYLETMMDERVLGVILSPSDPTSAAITAVIDSGIPIVAFDREVADPRADAVLADNIRGARLATEQLVAAGHRDIAFVGGRREVETGAERLDGYEIAMRRAALEPRSVDGGFRAEVARAAVSELLAANVVPTALVVANNLMTLGTLEALREAGRRVPDDVALVAIDDPPWASLVGPPLTTIAQPVRRMAGDAMELLLDRVGGREHSRRIVHPMELHPRSSIASPRT